MVVEDWKYRMIPANKGDYEGLPLNAAARQAANAWDPAKDPPAGEDCRNYGAVNLMRQPGRLHITWQDESDLEARKRLPAPETRLLSFAPLLRITAETLGKAFRWQPGDTVPGGQWTGG